ncbi:hypothetical protein Taro_010922 [Colocasia esculenta]|uniref:Uncharacterized protein n=1 Tax=Colocasia esculenta TaxID=4460 RepID=A0A843U4G2_COLES|nr:hypothetical protein [Colocasia esculenta]
MMHSSKNTSFADLRKNLRAKNSILFPSVVKEDLVGSQGVVFPSIVKEDLGTVPLKDTYTPSRRWSSLHNPKRKYNTLDLTRSSFNTKGNKHPGIPRDDLIICWFTVWNCGGGRRRYSERVGLVGRD